MQVCNHQLDVLIDPAIFSYATDYIFHLMHSRISMNVTNLDKRVKLDSPLHKWCSHVL